MGKTVLTLADWTQRLMGVSFYMVQLYFHDTGLNLVLHGRTSTLIQVNTKSRSNSLTKLLEDGEQPEPFHCRGLENKKCFEGFWWDLERFEWAYRLQGLTSPSAKQNTPRSMQLQLQSKGMRNFQAYLHSREGPPFNLPPYPACHRMIRDSMIEVVSAVLKKKEKGFLQNCVWQVIRL